MPKTKPATVTYTVTERDLARAFRKWGKLLDETPVTQKERAAFYAKSPATQAALCAQYFAALLPGATK